MGIGTETRVFIAGVRSEELEIKEFNGSIATKRRSFLCFVFGDRSPVNACNISQDYP